MNKLNQHYSRLLGRDSSWSVEEVDLDLPGGQVIVRLAFFGDSVSCAECDKLCDRHDTAPERTCRYSGAMQFKTEIRAAVRRCKCKECEGKTISVPWAGKHARFTWIFEAVAVKVLQAVRT